MSEIPNTANGDPWKTRDPDHLSNGAHQADLPTQIGRYRIEKVLGEGGFGRVYLAQDDQLGRPVAIKVPHNDRLDRPEDANAYLAEARIVASLDHPHIVPVYDVGTMADGLPYVVSKLIEGSDLAWKIQESRPSPTEAALLVAAVADALHYAHRHGLVHRDVKPGNILVDTAGRSYVGDFGLALKEEDFGKGAMGLAGTPAYMSPEQARGEGHRVDGRSDIFSLGVVFYELLTGQRPFRGATLSEVLDQIIMVEVRPPRQVDDTLARELERICLKAMSKRVVDRYTTARDMAEDLNHFCAEPPEVSKRAAGVPSTLLPERRADPDARSPASALPMSGSDTEAVKIVPQGLRSFDGGAADFFLALLPGPCNRDGLPDTIRFWKDRIEERDADHTFAIGVLYGPSGCGKSSLVKAGLMPHLANHVLAVYIEATRKETESRILKGVRKCCPGLPAALELIETMAALRRGHGVPGGQKVLIVLDQFEQWLHARHGEENTELAQALRQCDGERVQCLLLVRDDFWMGVTRFMRELEIELVPGVNTAAVDLFDLRHARKVLKAFGRAFGTLPERAGELASDQAAFVHQAVADLSQDGRIIPVRLALFAEMVKGKAWTPATLKEVGGTEGLGVAFLEETFSSPIASRRHRLHEEGARAVLKALLPGQGMEIKGKTRSYDELLKTSGYAGGPRDFEELLRILDSEVRLITPAEPEGPAPVDGQKHGKYYQLTHDYLVHSTRQWLARKQRETQSGRAEMRLAICASVWNAKPETRMLPALWEWLSICLLTKKKAWTRAERKMMHRATRYHARRGVVLAACLALLAWGSWEGFSRQKAQQLCDRLLNARTAEVPVIVADMAPYRRWINPRLRSTLGEADTSVDSRQRLHASLALLPVDPGQVEYLYTRLLTAEPQEAAVIRDSLVSHKEQLIERLWAVVKQPPAEHPGQRLSAASTLASYDPDSARWEQASPAVVEQLVVVNPVFLISWIEALRPVKDKLLGSLGSVFRDPKEERTAERNLAAHILADYAADQPAVLADLLLEADDKQFAVLFPTLQTQPERTVAHLQPLVATPIASSVLEDEKERLAKRQANAAVALLKLEKPATVWPLLEHSPDPRVRSYIIHRAAAVGVRPSMLLERLFAERLEAWPGAHSGRGPSWPSAAERMLFDPETSLHRALLLSLAEFGPEQWSPGEKETLIPRLLYLYRKDPDPGLHGAAGWLLRQWQQQEKLHRIDRELAKGKVEGQRSWYVNGQGQTMTVIPGPVAFVTGSPPTEAGREGGADGKGESQKTRRITRSLAIAASEVTVEQFLRFRANHVCNKQFAPTVDCPVTAVAWYEAAAYCNWLSEQEGIPHAQWCYLPNATGEYAEGMHLAPDYLERIGYRLPTEAEWEFACRAGAQTSRYYGATDELLGRYAWYTKNSVDRWLLPVGSLKPNDLGLFDMLGNVMEWSMGKPVGSAPGLGDSVADDVEDTEDLHQVNDTTGRVSRGGSFLSYTMNVRAAYRNWNRPSFLSQVIGFRVARTYRSGAASPPAGQARPIPGDR